jgi:eukaryotic-like serine/threonine-protein kinase
MSPRPLKTEEWQKVSRLFHASLDLPASDRLPWLIEQTSGEERILEEVESLLRTHEEGDSDGFLEKPAAARVLQSFVGMSPALFAPGDVTGDFTIEKVLGAGSFGTVYLATQNSLGRKVALKVSPNLGEEAQTMANLNHANIVSVYSEELHPKAHLRYICMQYVPGTNLETLLKELPKGEITGAVLLATIDRIGSGESAFDPIALKDRETLSRLGGLEAFLWMGARLAGALAYAHERGVLHLDVKPGNILVAPYGTPLLVDFNVSQRPDAAHLPGSQLVGGTDKYMPPEQRKLLDGKRGERNLSTVDGRADVFALGRVLEECFQKVLGSEPLESRPELEYLVRRCLAEDPADRFQTGAELAGALDGCLERRLLCDELPDRTKALDWLEKHPLTAFLLFTLVPQVVGSVVNITYNAVRIVSFLSAEQQEMFQWLVCAYNVVVYPAAIYLISSKLNGVLKYLRNPPRSTKKDAPSMETIRGRILDLPLWVVAAVTMGWMPGSIFFPAAIHAGTGPIARNVFGHFFVSFTLSWLIALTYSFLFVQFFLLRAFYPKFWYGSANIRETARRELAVLKPTLKLFPYMAGFVPLIGAILLIVIGPGPAHLGTYRLLVGGLIGLGMLGLWLALGASHLIGQTITALTGLSLNQLGTQKKSDKT